MTLLLIQGLYSNPIVLPSPYINEFQVFTGGHWTMEVLLDTEDYFWLDSVKVQNNAGFARVNAVSFIPDYGFFGFSFSDSDLDHSILANENGDIFTVTIYFTWGGNSMFTNSFELRYGNVTNPHVYAPTASQSIETFFTQSVVTLSDNPTLGLPNDTSGTFGTVSGIVYDLNGQPVPNQSFKIDNYFTTDATGHYSTRLFSRIFTWTRIYYEKWPGHYASIALTPYTYSMKPDSLITRNINLLEDLLVGIDPGTRNPSPVLSVFPNPVKNMITISYTTDLTSTVDDPELFIYDATGKIVIHKPLMNRQGVINLPVNLPDGLYLVTLKSGNKLQGTRRFIVSQGK